MSRGTKDLRELISVSRLTFRDSNSDGYSSGDSFKGNFDDATGYRASPSVVASERRAATDDACESAEHTSGQSSASSADHVTNKEKKKKRKKKRKQKNGSRMPVTELPKAPVLPPVIASGPPLPDGAEALSRGAFTKDKLELILGSADAGIISEWLEQANRTLGDLTEWCSCTKWFVAFAHFWLTDFPPSKRQDILKLEFDIACDELRLVFAAGLRDGTVAPADIGRLLAAVYREYPRRLCSASSGAYLFLDYLDTFTSERTTDYRQLLTDVKLSSSSRVHTHYLLAIRSFVLISAWHAVVTFYRKLHPEADGAAVSQNSGSRLNEQERNRDRVQEAMQNGYVDVCQYFFRSQKVPASSVDRHGRTFFFLAVASGQPKCVDYLLSKWPGCTDVNKPCDTGNSPIHVAVNLGDEALVRRLLLVPDIDVNVKNAQCDGATAMHLAAMHGHSSIVKLLLKSGKVDLSCLMGNQTALDFAKDLGQSDVVETIQEYIRSTSEEGDKHRGDG